MTGYAAFGRVERGRVSLQRPAAVPAQRNEGDDRVIGWRAASLEHAASWLHAVLTAAREQWALTTFYLFDANSWR